MEKPVVNEREGIDIYLNDICRLEFIINRLQEKKKELSDECNQISNMKWCYNAYYFNYQHSNFRREIRFIYQYDGTDYYFYIDAQVNFNDGNYHGPDSEFDSRHYYHVKLKDKNRLTPERLKELTEPVIRTETTKKFLRKPETREYEVDIWPCKVDDIYYHYSFSSNWRTTFIDLLEKEKVSLKNWYDERQEKKRANEADLLNIETEIKQAKELLEKYYNVNIIPNKYRTLGAIYSICDYYGSSSMTLAEIYYHIDLNEINSKLDTVIANQQQTVINQAILISQNDEIITQNQSVLNSLASIEANSNQILKGTNQIINNTANATQWAQIAANNAEACAWISLANYIK